MSKKSSKSEIAKIVSDAVENTESFTVQDGNRLSAAVKSARLLSSGLSGVLKERISRISTDQNGFFKDSVVWRASITPNGSRVKVFDMRSALWCLPDDCRVFVAVNNAETGVSCAVEFPQTAVVLYHQDNPLGRWILENLQSKPTHLPPPQGISGLISQRWWESGVLSPIVGSPLFEKIRPVIETAFFILKRNCDIFNTGADGFVDETGDIVCSVIRDGLNYAFVATVPVMGLTLTGLDVKAILSIFPDSSGIFAEMIKVPPLEEGDSGIRARIGVSFNVVDFV